MRRYHVILGEQRTTVSLDTILSEYLALELKQEPGTPEAHTAIRAWLQAQIDWHDIKKPLHLSKRLSAMVLEAIVRPDLKRAHAKLIDSLW
jgi:hypothetical protein